MATSCKAGGALIVVLLVMITLSILVTGLLKLYETDAVESVYAEQTEQAFWIAEAGLQRVLSRLRIDSDYRSGVSEYEDAQDVVTNGANRVELHCDSSGEEFWLTSYGTVGRAERELSLWVSLSAFGSSNGLITLNGDSDLKNNVTVNGNIYQNGNLKIKDIDGVSGFVMAVNYENYANGIPLPQDGLLDLKINANYFDYNFLNPVTKGVSVTNGKLALDGRVVVIEDADDLSSATEKDKEDDKGKGEGKGDGKDKGKDEDGHDEDGHDEGHDDKDDGSKLVVEGPGTLVVKGDFEIDTADLEIGNNVTLLVQGDLTTKQGVSFGSNVLIYVKETAELKNGASTGDSCALLAVGDVDFKAKSEFKGIVFSGGRVSLYNGSKIVGTLIAYDGFDVKANVEITFDKDMIPDDVKTDMISSTNVVVESSNWGELSSSQ